MAEAFFVKKLCMGKQIFKGANLWGNVLPGDYRLDLAMGELMVKRFQRSSQFNFPLIEPDLGY